MGQLYQGAKNGEVIRGVFNMLSEMPITQAMSGGAAGGASGVTREAGGGEIAQGFAGALAGLAAPAGIGLARNLGKGATVRIMTPTEIESVTAQALERQGIDWAVIPQNIKNGILKETEDVLKTGKELNPKILERLVDFRRVGATPTRGTLTLDPVQITKEKNLAKYGANSSDQGLQGLARVQNENNRKLIDAVNRVGANSADDAFAAGNQMMDAGEVASMALQRSIDAERAGIRELYSAARDSAGRSAELNRSAFSNQVNNALDYHQLGDLLPKDVLGHINRISSGSVPFDVNYAEQLRQSVNRHYGRADNATKYALDIVRQGLDDVQLLNPAAGAPVSGGRAVGAAGQNLGQDAIDAFNKGRVAHANMMRRIEKTPALKALYNGDASPDDFIQQFIIGKNKSATAEGVKNLANELKKIDPQAFESVKGSIAQRLKMAAIGKGSSDEIGNFSAARFRSALQDIGQDKLSSFFSPKEMADIRAISNVANYISTQPAGSAVNNSNTASAILGSGMEMLDRASKAVPLFQFLPSVNNVARGAASGIGSRSAQNITPALASGQVPSSAGLAVSPVIASPRSMHDPSQRADRSTDEYQYARNAALQAGDYDAVRILDEDARVRGYIR